MLEIIQEEIKISAELRKKIEWACKMNNTKPIIKNGSILKLEPTNIAYLEPHRAIINGDRYLFFNGLEIAYYGDLNTEIKLSNLKDFIKNHSNR